MLIRITFAHVARFYLLVSLLIFGLGVFTALPADAVTITEFSAGITAGSGLYGITEGPDGNLWFAEFTGNRIGRITPAGVVTEFSTGITAGSSPAGITAVPDGNLWFTEFTGNRIGQVLFSENVPTMSEWSMIIFMILAAFGSSYFLRKQRQAHT